jgi:hypothetical protein
MALTQVTKDVLNSSQANITQVGTLANLTVSGNITADSIGVGTSSTDGDTNNKLVVVSGSGSGAFRAKAGVYTLTSIQYNGTAGTVTDCPFYTIGTNIGGVVAFTTDAIERMRITSTGNVGINTANPTATLHVNGNAIVSGLTTLAETTEILDTKSSVTGTVVHDFSTSAIWYYSSISGAVTANITNVPTTDNRVTSISIVVNQGGTGYIVNGLQIDGAAQTIRWQANTVPTASTNRVDVFTFSLLRAANVWTVLGSATSHG